MPRDGSLAAFLCRLHVRDLRRRMQWAVRIDCGSGRPNKPAVAAVEDVMRFLDKKLQGWRGTSAVLAAIIAGLAPANAAPLVLTCAIINEGAWEREHHFPHEARARAIYAAEAGAGQHLLPR